MTSTTTVKSQLIDMIDYLPEPVIKKLLSIAQQYQANTDVSTNDPFYSESNMAHLMRGIAALNAGEGIEHDLLDDDAG